MTSLSDENVRGHLKEKGPEKYSTRYNPEAIAEHLPHEDLPDHVLNCPVFIANRGHEGMTDRIS